MRKLEFTGTVKANDRELVIPGRDALFLKPDDWPRKLASGSLSIEIVARIKGLFEPFQLAEFLNTPRRLGALGHASSEEGHALLRAEWTEEERLREDARNLTLLEWAKDLLVDEEG
jgi:hypothetical protein